MVQVHGMPSLLRQMESKIADEKGGQELDFKQWGNMFEVFVTT